MNQYPPAPDPWGHPADPNAPAPSAPPPPPPDSGQYGAYAPPSQAGQPQYPQYPQPPYGQYGPPSQYPQAPQQLYGQYGPPSQYPQYPQAPYGQYGPPSQYPQPGYYAPPAPRSNQQPLIWGGIAAVVVIALLVVFVVVHPFGGGSVTGVTGTWYGTGTASGSSSTSTSFSLGTYLNLTQNGSQVSGTGELCSRSGSLVTVSFDVTGTINGSNLDMSWTRSGVSSGSSAVHVTGTLSNNQLVLSSNDSGSYHSTLQQGDHNAFSSACSALP